ncbi:pseudaminic acid cytidylyltransferase [Psychrobacter celer]|uniref:pseudaminic acid cytidylyltransferase n=1 Tax=Psychrobacter celer TaxID=306572 RepID=UPI003FD09F19
MANIAVIPARGGSKRIPRKNIKEFYGKPLIAYSIKAAIQSKCFDRIVVSTDDEEIAEISLKLGAEVPFMRDINLADDYTGTASVIKDTLNKLDDDSIEYACLIYATAPFLEPKYLMQGLEMLKESQNAHFTFSVTSYAFPIQRAVTLSETGQVKMINSEMLSLRSQDLEEAWHDAGQFYWGTKEAWQQALPIFSEHSLGVKLPRYLVQDIDTLEDWKTAELMYQAWRGL